MDRPPVRFKEQDGDPAGLETAAHVVFGHRGSGAMRRFVRRALMSAVAAGAVLVRRLDR